MLTDAAVKDRWSIEQVVFVSYLISETNPAQTASMEEFIIELNQVRRVRPMQGVVPRVI